MSEVKKSKLSGFMIFFGAMLLGILIGVSFFLLPQNTEKLEMTHLKNYPVSGDTALIPGLLLATQENPNNPNLWVQLGNAYYDTMQTKHAISAYQEALSLNLKTPAVFTDYATMLRLNGEFKKSLQYYDQALLLSPNNVTALYNKGLLLYYDLNRTEDAFSTWNTLIKHQPNIRTPDGRLVKTVIKDLNASFMVLPLH